MTFFQRMGNAEKVSNPLRSYTSREIRVLAPKFLRNLAYILTIELMMWVIQLL